jgi:hypothetical protein
MVLCSSCHKKLEINFSEWKKRHQEKTFDDFKVLMCVTETDLQNTSVKTKTKPKGLKYWIGFAAAFAIFYAVGQFGGEAIVKFFKSEKTSKEVLSQTWIKETYGNFGLTVETPVIMTKADLTFPDNIKQVIDQMDTYNYISAKGFKVLINSIKYNPAVGQTDLQGAANGSINEMKMQKGVTDFDYTEDYISKNDVPGFVQKGTYKQDGVEVEFINTGFSKGLILWQVFVAYQLNDEVGRIASKRVIESVEINYKNAL